MLRNSRYCVQLAFQNGPIYIYIYLYTEKAKIPMPLRFRHVTRLITNSKLTLIRGGLAMDAIASYAGMDRKRIKRGTYIY